MALETDLHPDVFNERLFHRAYQLVKDSVPNIRMTIANCFACVLAKQPENSHRYNVIVVMMRELQHDDDSDVRDIALSCNLPPRDDDPNESARSTNQNAFADVASMSTASTAEWNISDLGEYSRNNEESDESQDSISLYLDTDEKNTSESPGPPSAERSLLSLFLFAGVDGSVPSTQTDQSPVSHDEATTLQH